jgi:hypothetical protein
MGTRFLQAAAAVVLVAAGAAIVVPALTGSGQQDSDSTTAESASGGRGTDSVAGAGTPVTASNQDYTETTVGPAAVRLTTVGKGRNALSGQTPAPVAAPGVNSPSPGSYAADQGAVARLSGGAALEQCATALADGVPTQPLAVDLARFHGQPAAVIVLPGDDPSKLWVYVVGPGCTPGDEQLRYFVSVPRS